MSGSFAVEMMSDKAPLWRCLHGGPLTAGSLDAADEDGQTPFAQFRGRNLAFLERLTETYGACAVVAKAGDAFVGHLRFYPRAVHEMAEPGLGLCLQQEFPSGPADDLGRRTFPPLDKIRDKTLLVHCMMVASRGPGGAEYRRHGIGRRMARTLTDWAARMGWHAVEATAYTALPLIYMVSGQTGRSFWESLGFRLARTEREPALEEENDFAWALREQAIQLGSDPARISDRYVMRLDIS
jgi:GNAT superfamily N-acetyltransferase